MYATVFTVLASVWVSLLHAAEEKNIDQVLESVETVLRFHKQDPSSELAVINKVQKVLDRIKSASKYTEDMFTPNQYRANLANIEARPLKIHWEDKLFSYEIKRNNKKSNKSVFANGAPENPDVGQTADDKNYSGFEEEEVVEPTNNNENMLRAGKKPDAETHTFINTNKNTAEELDEKESKESLPDLQYAGKIESTAISSIESDDASGPGQRTVASSEYVVQEANFRSKIRTKTPVELLPQITREIKKNKVEVMPKDAKKKYFLRANYRGTIPKRTQTLSNNADIFSYKFKNVKSPEIVTTIRKAKLADNYGTSKRSEFENTIIKKKQTLRDINRTNNSELGNKRIINVNSETNSENSVEPIIVPRGMSIELPQNIKEETNQFQSDTGILNHFNQSEESYKNHSNLKPHRYNSSLHFYIQDNLQKLFEYKSTLDNTANNILNLNASETPKADNPNLGNTSVTVNENKLEIATLKNTANNILNLNASETTKADNPNLGNKAVTLNENKLKIAILSEPALLMRTSNTSTKNVEFKTTGLKTSRLTSQIKNGNWHVTEYFTNKVVTRSYKNVNLPVSSIIEHNMVKRNLNFASHNTLMKEYTNMFANKESKKTFNFKSDKSKNKNVTQNTQDTFYKSSVEFRSEDKSLSKSYDYETNENDTEMIDPSLFFTDPTDSTPSFKSESTTNTSNTHNEKGIPKITISGNITEKPSNISNTMSRRALFRSRDEKGESELEVNKTNKTHPFNVANEWDFAYDDFIYERRREAITF